MRNREYHIDEVLAKYVANEATPEEKEFVSLWLTENADNVKHLEQINLIFTKVTSSKEAQRFDTDAAWTKVKSKLNRPESRTIEFKPSTSYFNISIRIAASIVIVLGIGFSLYNHFTKPSDQVDIQSTNKIITDTLPDGSTAVLNKQSSLAYEFNPKKNTRKLKLKGEAYFDVKHEADKPFIIETQDVIIEDLGTTFNVKSYEKSSAIEVYVESGEVKFYTLQDKGLSLRAGQTGIYNKQSHTFMFMEKSDSNILAYKNQIFQFNNTDLNSIVESMNDVYEIKIVLANTEIGKCRITVNFNGETIDSIVDILAETLNLDVVKSEKQIILDGKGCLQ